jgi:phosphotransferase system enzyme I (PtsP)
MLLEIEAEAAKMLIHDELRRSGGGETLRPQLARFAESHGIPV